MGFIASVARCVRDNRLSRRLSNAKPQRLDDDVNDLIKTTSQSASLAPAESIASVSTAVHHSSQEPVVPTESPAHQKQLNPFELNIHTLFDEVDTLDPATSRAIRALSMPEYPVLKLDTIQSPFDTPAKTLGDPIDTGDDMKRKKSIGSQPKKSREGKRQKIEQDLPTENTKSMSRIRRSMASLLKRRSLRSSKSPPSLRTLRNPHSPKWLDGASVSGEDVRADEKREEKWLEANGLSNEKDKLTFWNGQGRGGLW
ncbi:hypothetical protein N7462_003315 [Penicillium macrosclerotiorum]|uniref:uncharacterized protein n=1 Tax=Penicillium macrosclerotiorum TaxID=303699 RepID=UPI0025490DD3|nr:uncharacterized protein N7462_003315 [Penicillium macrosclerotiorum]KAJ5688923.1 hypothetical protein N7462_003315 [Penicillium macrosclerotiorum]